MPSNMCIHVPLTNPVKAHPEAENVGNSAVGDSDDWQMNLQPGGLLKG